MKRLEKTQLPTYKGSYTIHAFGHSDSDQMPHIALVSIHCDPSRIVPIRMHSECLTGDLFSSKRCDCGEQLDYAQRYLSENGGVLLYLRQEGRGIGLINKLRAYNLQDQGLDTLEANVHLGFEPDERDYSGAVQMLEDLGIRRIRLMTNNPLKIQALEDSSIEVHGRIPILIDPQPENQSYIETKRAKMGHLH